MKHFFTTACLLFALATGARAQSLPATPAQSKRFKTISEYEEIVAFLNEISAFADVRIIGSSVQQRNIYVVEFPKGSFGKNTGKLKVMIFAQQHGNEQSGKEAALLLISELSKPGYRHLFEQIDLAVIPQINPDGGELNQRRNAKSTDLNRNHLILTEPETQSLHAYFDRNHFDLTVDVHEYSPFGDSWMKYGYRKNAQVTFGALTNYNIGGNIRDFEKKTALPFVMKEVASKGYTTFEYCPGGPPGMDYIRFSTFDINDGRQSFGSQGTLSFIQEGMNGEDMFTDNLEIRATSQLSGLMGFLRFAKENAVEIRELVRQERALITEKTEGSEICIQAVHKSDGTILQLPLVNIRTLKDSTVNVTDFRPIVHCLKNAEAPFAYLIPKGDKMLVQWIETMNFETLSKIKKGKFNFSTKQITGFYSVDFEDDTIQLPQTVARPSGKFNLKEYIILPVNQLKGRIMVQALEPESMISLATYPQFAYLTENRSIYPILTVSRKK